MPLFDAIFSSGVKAAGDLIEKFHMSPEEKAQAQQALGQLQFQQEQLASGERVELAKVQAALDTADIQASSQVRMTDSSSTDWFVRRSRPSFIWVMVVSIACSLILFPILNLIFTKHLEPMVIPSAYLQLFGPLMLGLGGLRTLEKLKDKD